MLNNLAWPFKGAIKLKKTFDEVKPLNPDLKSNFYWKTNKANKIIHEHVVSTVVATAAFII